MGEDYEKLKILLQCLVRGSALQKIRLPDLFKMYEKLECENLRFAAERFGFKTASELIESMPEFKMLGNGLQAVVQLSDIASSLDLKKETCKQSCSVVPANGMINQNPIATIMQIEPKLVKSIDQVIPNCVPIEDFNSPVIQILEVQNPHRFWFAERSELKKVSELMKRMSQFYFNSDRLKVSKEELFKGLYVTVLYKDLWHRGMILKVWPRNMARILYVDFGTVEDVTLNHIRFLTEDFLALPSTAHRGVLSHVQPIDGVWSKEAKIFLEENVYFKRIEAKIFKRNALDSSYFMAIRTSSDGGEKNKLVSKEMIERGFCFYDANFTDNTVVNEKELEFIEYENGKHLKDPDSYLDDSWLPTAVNVSVEAANNIDEWLPTAQASKSALQEHQKQVNNVEPNNHKIRENEATKFVPTQVTYNKVAQAQKTLKPPLSPNRNLSKETNKKPVVVDSPSLKAKSYFIPQCKLPINCVPKASHPLESSVELSPQVAPLSENIQIEKQILSHFKVGKVMKIYIHVVNNLDGFYFYVKDEMLDIAPFLKDFNFDCKNIATPNDNFEAGVDVVTFADENFCRGRIINKIFDENSYKIFLLDFGIFVERPKNEIFKLREIWMKRQAAVYLGQLANVPEHAFIKSRDHFEEITSSRYVRVQISRIYDKSVELILNDF